MSLLVFMLNSHPLGKPYKIWGFGLNLFYFILRLLEVLSLSVLYALILNSVQSEQNNKLIKGIKGKCCGNVPCHQSELFYWQFPALKWIYVAVRQQGSSNPITALIRLNYLWHNWQLVILLWYWRWYFQKR